MEVEKPMRYTKNRMLILRELYNADDWFTPYELVGCGTKYRVIQKHLRDLYNLGILLREKTRPSYRYKIDKSKDLKFYFDYLEVFRMKSQKHGVPRCNHLKLMS